ncbi:MAG: hypothetical protein MRY79_08385, partial [Alphaproteobacteria bacterium]|nr:hypothetical protein [Alphaproteobacteria bacterium]
MSDKSTQYSLNSQPGNVEKKPQKAGMLFPKSMEALHRGLKSVVEHKTPHAEVSYGQNKKGEMFFDVIGYDPDDDEGLADGDTIDALNELYDDLQVFADGLNIKIEMFEDNTAFHIHFNDPTGMYNVLWDCYDEYSLFGSEDVHITCTDPETGEEDFDLLSANFRKLSRLGRHLKENIEEEQILDVHPMKHSVSGTHDAVVAGITASNAYI